MSDNTAGVTTVVVPGEVRTYVLEQKTPTVAFEGDLAVGTALPETVEIHTIPDQPEYNYVIVNDKRVLHCGLRSSSNEKRRWPAAAGRAEFA
ncbi:DUF1236 domain-containing protein [Rhizobium herbae]|jgi:hypothetical protein